MRYECVDSACGCGKVSLARLEKAVKGRTRAVVESRVSFVASKLLRVFQEVGPRIAKVAASIAEEEGALGKASRNTENLIARILREIDLHGFSVALMDALEGDVIQMFAESALAAHSAVAAQVGSMERSIVEQVDVAALDFARVRAAKLVGMRRSEDGGWEENPNADYRISDVTRKDLRDLIYEAIEEGWSAQTLQNRILDSFSFSTNRAEMIARTELAFAHVNGNMQGWFESGEVFGKRSILADTHLQVDVCDENEQEGVIGLAENFQSGDLGAPYHPNCLCDVVPVLFDEMYYFDRWYDRSSRNWVVQLKDKKNDFQVGAAVYVYRKEEAMSVGREYFDSELRRDMEQAFRKPRKVDISSLLKGGSAVPPSKD